MAFSSDVTVTGTSVARTYSLISTVGSKAIRRNSNVPLATPDLLTISHQEVKRAGRTSDRHLVRIDWSKEDADKIVDTLTGYIVLEVPRSQFSTADVTDLINLLKNFYSAGNTVKILNSEP